MNQWKRVVVLGSVLLWWWSTCVVVAAEPSAWGQIVNPDGDCTLRLNGDRLTIAIPAGTHDLWPGRPDPGHRFNAPRIVREIEGDFVAQVKVEADWFKSGNVQTNNGAGLFVWDSPENYIRRERHVFVSQGTPRCFVPPMYFKDGGKRHDSSVLNGVDYFPGRATWLRVERKGQTIETAISHDGREWIGTGSHETDFRPKVQIGVHAFNISPYAFEAVFEGFSVVRSN